MRKRVKDQVPLGCFLSSLRVTRSRWSTRLDIKRREIVLVVDNLGTCSWTTFGLMIMLLLKDVLAVLLVPVARWERKLGAPRELTPGVADQGVHDDEGRASVSRHNMTGSGGGQVNLGHCCGLRLKPTCPRLRLLKN